MISFHPDNRRAFDPRRYWHGFRAVSTDDVKRISSCITNYIWSPIEWKEGSRKEANFLSCNWLVFDFDTPEMGLAEARKAFCDTIHIIGTTRNHQKDKGGVTCDRFRVMMPFAYPINDLRTYRYTMHQLMKSYPVDKACKDGARFFYPCSEIVSVEAEGFTVDVYDNVPEDFERYNPKKWDGYKKSRVLPSHVMWFLKNRVEKGSRNKEAFRVACDLIQCGYAEDQVYAALAESPTYKTEMNRILERELRGTVASAVRRIGQEVKDEESLCQTT